jgi:hypothetical protein
MIRTAVVTTIATTAVWLGVASAAEVTVRPRVVRSPVVVVVPVQDCSAFYDDYRHRGFGWGSGPGSGLGFRVFEGALPQYPVNSFPNWYGDCLNWGHYSSAGSVRRW